MANRHNIITQSGWAYQPASVRGLDADLSGIESAVASLEARSGANYGRKLAHLGDSVVAGIIGAPTPNPNNVVQGGALLYGIMQSAGRIEWGGQFGVPGETTAQILARVPAVIAAAPTACLITGGTNDGNVATTAAGITAIVGQLTAAGIEPILSTIPPSSIPYDQNSGVHRIIRNINGWLTRYATAKSLRIVDFFGVLVDPLTGLYRTGHNSDVTHPNQTGYRVMGKALADALVPSMPAGRSYRLASIRDDANFTPDSLFMNGTTVPASGWYTDGGAVASESLTTDANFAGRVWEVTKTENSTRVLQVDIGTAEWNFMPGDLVSVSFKLTTSGLESSGARVTVSVPNNSRAAGQPDNMLSCQVGVDLTAGEFYYESLVPPGTNGSSMQIRCDGGSGAFSYKVGEFSVRSLTRSSMLV